MSAKLRVGIVGTSGWTDFMYLPSLKNDPQAELAAICGRNPERAGNLADKYQIPEVFTNYQEMIQKGGLDAIIIAAPDDLHHEITMMSIEAGLHVLCDKPLAITAGQAREMYEAAESAKVKHMVMFTYRWLPIYRYVHDLLVQGSIGRIYHCEFRYQMGYGRSGEYQWRLDKKRANGALADIGSHMIDMAHWLVGDIIHVCALLGVSIDRYGMDGSKIDPANDSAFLMTRYANGVQGMIHVSTVTYLAERSSQQQISLYGESGSLELEVIYSNDKIEAIINVAHEGNGEFQTMKVPDRYWGGVDHSDPYGVFKHQHVGSRGFVNAIINDKPISPSFLDGYKTQQVIEAAIRSHASGSWIDI